MTHHLIVTSLSNSMLRIGFKTTYVHLTKAGRKTITAAFAEHEKNLEKTVTIEFNETRI